jgi:hypothetical protein
MRKFLKFILIIGVIGSITFARRSHRLVRKLTNRIEQIL